ncbi:hypothetical protein HPB52_020879 [Rhipicephalus sanguineus]|uniref:RNase H type-1 domain-containing protein n=1 Tax=Rhipicephalus sanguineus TaxID=34632 RepID=A0A9D4Q2Y6_RHISA|nr:hypothetical protein HPB52_020879 [Rhipicephalus sanguineus]
MMDSRLSRDRRKPAQDFAVEDYDNRLTLSSTERRAYNQWERYDRVPTGCKHLPPHVGIAGNEEADALAKAAHQPGAPITGAVAARDYTQARLKKLLVTVHPDSRVANERGPKLLPETGLSRRDRSALLRLRTGCAVAALLQPEAAAVILRPSSTSSVPALAWHRNARGSLRPTEDRACLPPHLNTCSSRPHLPPLRSLVEFLDETGIAAYR